MPQFLVAIHPARASFPGDATPAELSKVGEHFSYLQKKLLEGVVILVGRTQDETPLGLNIIEVENIEAAQRFVAEDPAVVAGIFLADNVRPYHIALLRGRDEADAAQALQG